MQKNKKILIRAGVAALALAGLATVLAAVAFTPSGQPIGYVGQPVVSNSNVSSGTSRMYSIDYDANKWSGNLHSYPVSKAGAVSTADDWIGGASEQILAQSANEAVDPKREDRRLIVTKKSGGPSGTRFRWDELSSAQRGALDPVQAAAGAVDSPLLDYIRGSNANEGTAAGKFRVRGYGLGDIIHSTPVYWNDGVNRTVFVGANDGMLHAINAADGKERFAYIPSVLLPKLKNLSNQAYAHEYFVDGRMDIKKFSDMTILTGTLAGGGKALFGLNVSDAAPADEQAAAAKVLWEITNSSTGFGDLGDTYAAPTLLTLPSGASALVVGNGYNNTGTGHAVLYLINALDGALIRALDTGSGTTASPNGLSTPSLWDSDRNGVKDTAYAGDIDGNLWKFRLVAPYTVTKLHTNTSGAAHAVTMAPGLSAHPLGGVMVTFVTGRMLTAGDATDTTEHFAYGVWDGAPAANDAWLQQDLTEKNFDSGSKTVRVRIATQNLPNWTAGAGHHKGWKTKLPLGGERVVGDGAFVTGSVFQFLSTNPTVNPSIRPPGENWWMQLNVLTGGDNAVTQFDLNDDREFTSDDQVVVRDSSGQNVRRDPVGRYMGGGVRSQLISISAGGVDVFQSNFDRNGAPVVIPTTTETSTRTTGDRGVSGGHFDTDIFCYTNCSGSGRPVNDSSGAYISGDDKGSATAGLKYTHVHEYDDIYDVIGINMLAPSQNLQKLAGVKYGTSTSTTSSDPSNTKQLIQDKQYPASAVLVSSTTDPVWRYVTKQRKIPTTTYAAKDAPSTAVDGYPKTTKGETAIVTTTQTSVTTTVTEVAAVNAEQRADGNWYYNLRTNVTKWDTVTSTVDTVPVMRFKVLMSNQAYSPAVKFKLDGTEVPVYDFQTTAGLTASGLTTYKLGAVGEPGAISSLILQMPLDAFNVKDWGTGQSRAGLHPTRPQCLGVISAGKAGPDGEWRNGALTVQIVDASITDADIQPNVANEPKRGYRLKNASLKTKLIAEYLIYWHHPNQKCMGDLGWTMAPPQDAGPSDAKAGIKAPGSDDPIGQFTPGTGPGTPAEPLTPGTVTTVVDNGDGTRTTTTVVTTENAGGGYTITTTVTTEQLSASEETGIETGGAVDGGGRIDTTGIDKNAAALGRITWRELQP